MAAPSLAMATGTMVEKQLAAARQLCVLQKLSLDHAVAELKAGLGEVEELMNTRTLSDALTIQARAFRRGQDSMMNYLGEFAKATRP